MGLAQGREVRRDIPDYVISLSSWRRLELDLRAADMGPPVSSGGLQSPAGAQNCTQPALILPRKGGDRGWVCADVLGWGEAGWARGRVMAAPPTSHWAESLPLWRCR